MVTLVTGLNLDNLEQEIADAEPKPRPSFRSFNKLDLDELFKIDKEVTGNDESGDKTFELNYITQHYGRDAPDFVGFLHKIVVKHRYP